MSVNTFQNSTASDLNGYYANSKKNGAALSNAAASPNFDYSSSRPRPPGLCVSKVGCATAAPLLHPSLAPVNIKRSETWQNATLDSENIMQAFELVYSKSTRKKRHSGKENSRKK